MIDVINVRKHLPADMPSNFTYIGRPVRHWQGSPLGNPFRLISPELRGATLERYRAWLYTELRKPDSPQLAELKRLATMAKTGNLLLGCWCAPDPCHGDVVKAAVEWLISENMV